MKATGCALYATWHAVVECALGADTLRHHASDEEAGGLVGERTHLNRCNMHGETTDIVHAPCSGTAPVADALAASSVRW